LIDRYLDAIESSDHEALGAALHPAVQVILHPNLFAPDGSTRQLTRLSSDFAAGQGVLSVQRFGDRQYDELGPDQVLARMVWTGETAIELPGLPVGTSLKADVASLVTFEGDWIVRQENWDCYYPAKLPSRED